MNSIFRQIIIASTLLSSCCLIYLCFSNSASQPTKINGASIVAPPKKFDHTAFKPLHDIHCNWVSIMPYAYINDSSGALTYNLQGQQWWGETKKGIIESINIAHEQQLKVMLKPHVWIGWGTFTGTFKPKKGYSQLKRDLKTYLLDFAAIAQKQKVDIYCFGIEWKQFITEEPAYFDSLIHDIKQVYTGKLTYAANWDFAFHIPFWEKLDFIGIDAYFPLVDATSPQLLALEEAWLPWKQKIKTISQKHHKPVLFTEYGFRNINNCANKPWESHQVEGNNQTCQCHAYQSLFNTFWNETWFSGGFFWKYHTSIRNKNNNAFTPQHKEVWEVIKKQYQGSVE